MKQVCGQNVCAIVVTWNINNSFMANFRAIIPQVAQAVIIDNGSCPDTVLMLKALLPLYADKVKIIFNNTNKGISAAQNQGVDIALKSGFEWILLLDHDSRPAPDMVVTLLMAYDTIIHSGSMAGPGAEKDHKSFCHKKIGLLAPNKKEEKFIGKMKLITPGRLPFWRTFGTDKIVCDVRSVIASGSLIKKEVFWDLGRFNETFFMDYVDVEFCLRMHSRGWQIAAVRDAVLHHNLGDIQPHYFLGHGISVSNHDACRRYTMFRNRVTVWKQYFFSQPEYIFFDMGMAVYELVKICLYESGAGHKFKAAIKGMMDGAARSSRRSFS